MCLLEILEWHLWGTGSGRNPNLIPITGAGEGLFEERKESNEGNRGKELLLVRRTASLFSCSGWLLTLSSGGMPCVNSPVVVWPGHLPSSRCYQQLSVRLLFWAGPGVILPSSKKARV